MSDLVDLAAGCGFVRPRTYIASGNLVFDSDLGEAEVKAALETALKVHVGKPVGVLVRTGEAMAAVAAANPFADAPGDRVVTIFLNAPPPADALAAAIGVQAEQMRLGGREIHVWYVDGQARSKLKIPAALAGTARNMNTVKKLAAMAAAG